MTTVKNTKEFFKYFSNKAKVGIFCVCDKKHIKISILTIFKLPLKSIK